MSRITANRRTCGVDARSPRRAPLGSLSSRHCRRTRASRDGLAATEFAVCLPVIVLIVLATIESCTMVFLKQSLTISAYEGVRTALEQNASPTDVDATCMAILRDRRVAGGSVRVVPATFPSLAPGEYISVTVSAPADRNAVLPGNFFRGMTFSSTATMMKEF